MSNSNLNENDAATVRERVKYEDQLFNARSTIILTLNGLMAVAASLQLPDGARLAVAIVIIVINILWINVALDAKQYIQELTLRLKASDHKPIDEDIRFALQEGKKRISPTNFMCIVVPSLLLAGWILGLVLSK